MTMDLPLHVSQCFNLMPSLQTHSTMTSMGEGKVRQESRERRADALAHAGQMAREIVGEARLVEVAHGSVVARVLALVDEDVAGVGHVEDAEQEDEEERDHASCEEAPAGARLFVDELQKSVAEQTHGYPDHESREVFHEAFHLFFKFFSQLLFPVGFGFFFLDIFRLFFNDLFIEGFFFDETRAEILADIFPDVLDDMIPMVGRRDGLEVVADKTRLLGRLVL